MLFSGPDGKITTEPPMVSFLDHGFLFGDSIYEVCRIYEGKFFGWTEHIDRLILSGRFMGLSVEARLSEIRERAEDLLKKLGEPNAVVRIILTRGIGVLHIDTRSCLSPNLFMAAWKFDRTMLPQTQRLVIAKIRRNPREALDPAIKSGNYLNSVLAFKEATDLGYDDAVLLNPSGDVTELTTSNIGWINQGNVETPDTGVGILHGVTRKILTEICRVGIGHYGVDRLRAADEVFVLSTLKEVLPVSEIRFEDGSIKKYEKNTGTLELQRLFRQAVEERLQQEKSLWI